ncbi:MAG TPA: hypothetical protein VJU84_05805 [Pyrinomonadaceae bacterium]|nr:hypothetical protein [Pyrinomonadaceae bacterium]
MMTTEKYELKKWLWTEADFEQMEWHDVRIHALAFHPDAYELAFDIDYIFEWIHPAPETTYFKFWVAPATLVFENVNELRIDLEPHLSLDLKEIERAEPQKPKNTDYIDRDVEWYWKLDTHSGEISLRSVGYKQYIRQEPVLTQGQVLDAEARGGFSFHRGRMR